MRKRGEVPTKRKRKQSYGEQGSSYGKVWVLTLCMCMKEVFALMKGKISKKDQNSKKEISFFP